MDAATNQDVPIRHTHNTTTYTILGFLVLQTNFLIINDLLLSFKYKVYKSRNKDASPSHA